ncbi:MAG TPA: hypothetical protein VHZ54_12170 [Solirubrobacterales bacterium]|nr:hypothetical protein [Solirubrobacterales bacterium]
MPEAFRAIGHTDELWEPDLTVEQVHEVVLAGEFDGRAVSRSLYLYPVPALDWADIDEAFEFGRIDRGLHVFLSFRRSGDEMRMRCVLELEADASVSLADALEAARLLIAVDEGTASLSFDDLGSVELPVIEDQRRRDEHRGTAWLFEQLILISDALGVTFELDHTVTVEEADDVGTVVDILQSGKGRYIVADVIRYLSPGELDEWRDPRGPLVARIEATVEVLGKTVDLGVAEVELPPPDSTKVLEPADDGRDRVQLRWNDGPGVPFKIISGPDEEPPELGIWPPDQLPPVDP